MRHNFIAYVHAEFNGHLFRCLLLKGHKSTNNTLKRLLSGQLVPISLVCSYLRSASQVRMHVYVPKIAQSQLEFWPRINTYVRPVYRRARIYGGREGHTRPLTAQRPRHKLACRPLSGGHSRWAVEFSTAQRLENTAARRWSLSGK